MSRDDELFDQIGERFRSRYGWRFEPSATPGAPPSWCLDFHGESHAFSERRSRGNHCLSS